VYNGYWVPFLGIKWQGLGIGHPPPYSTEVEERVKLYLYSPPRAFMSCSRVNFTLLYHYCFGHHLVHSTVNNFVNANLWLMVSCLLIRVCIIPQHWCRPNDIYAFGQEFPAIIPQDIHLKSSLDSSVSQIIPVGIFIAFSSVDIHLIVADMFQDSTFKYSVPAVQFPACSLLVIVFAVTNATEQCNQVNKIQSTIRPS
jgi:hypothetical protein